ncbi:MAG: polysaccharide deacetylase family protein [Proteobacteria bacterium]|nr:polysaccharide deacetylase family protein [Pseudomonadota bacterium]
MTLGRHGCVLAVAAALAAPALAIELPVLDFNAIVRAEGLSPDCALTFDDGPASHTAELLDVLAAKSAKATFFVVGVNIRRFPHLVRRMIADGHEVENHSYDHPDMLHLSEAERRREILDTQALLESLGAKPHFFRPPYGAYDVALIDEARRDGLTVVLWSHDSEDWRYHTIATIEGRIVPPATHGAHGVFLFHDLQPDTVTIMPAIIDELRAKGCRFVTVLEWVEDSRAAARAAPAVRIKATTPKGWLTVDPSPN